MFSMHGMADRKERVIDRILAAAKKLDWNQSELARQMSLAGKQVSAQDITNWKARGDIPADRHFQAAKTLMCSVDELLTGRAATKSNVVQMNAPWPFPIDRETYERLPDLAKGEIIGVMTSKAREHGQKANSHTKKLRG